MQAPYDREHGQVPGGGDPPPGHGGPGEGLHGQPAHDSYAADGYYHDYYHEYQHDPYAGGDPLGQDPLQDVSYDPAAYPPPHDPGPGTGAGYYPGPAYPQGPAPGIGEGYHPGPAYPQQPPPPHAQAPVHDSRHWTPDPQQQPYPYPNSYPQQQQQYGDPGAGSQYTGVDDLVGRAGEQRFPAEEPSQGVDDAFAYLFRDQQTSARQPPPRPAPPPQGHGYQHTAPPPPPPPQPYYQYQPEPGPEPEPEPAVPEPPRRPGRAASLLRSSAIMAAGTLVSRVTGFIRQLVIVAALGGMLLGDTYTVAWNLPNMIYILIIGGGLNSVFVPQLVRAMKSDEDGGEAYANRLLTLVMTALGALVVLGMIAAPLLIQSQSTKIADDQYANEVALSFVRYCLPTIFFMGLHVVLGQILNARERFGPMMWTPVLNNIVVIFTFGMFLWVYGPQSSSRMSEGSISAEGVRLLGMGTLLGLTVQSLAMIPYVRAAGFRIRPRFDWRGHGMGKTAGLAKWTVLFVLANQLGLTVVTQIATWAGDNAASQGYPGTGIIAYSSALLIWQMPQAIITVSVMAALMPRLSRSAADGDTAAVRDDLSHGLRTSAVAIVPVAFAFLALGVPMCTLLFGATGEESARSFGYILMAFGLGLIPFSAQYVVLRAFYAYEDTRTPFYNTIIVSAIWISLSGLSFVILPDRWVVSGIAVGYGFAYALGVLVAWRRLQRRMRTDLDGARVVRTYIRLAGASLPAALLGGATGYGIMGALGEGVLGSLAALVVGGLVLLIVFFLAARRMRIDELTALVGMVRARLGR